MLNRMHLLTAMCLAVSTGLFVVGPMRADDLSGGQVSPSRETETDVALPAGIEAKNLNSDKAIERAFKDVTNDAMNKTGFDNLINRLVDEDRVRINKSLDNGRSLNNVTGDKNKRLTDLISDIEGTWKSKYNQGFDVDINKVYTTNIFHIQTGEVVDANMLVGKWPVNAAFNADKGGKLTPSEAQDTKGKVYGGDVNLEKGRDVAIVHFMRTSGLPGVNASMIREAGGWKFDIPNDVNAQALYDNVCKGLSHFDQQKDKWPSDVNEAYRQMTHLLVASLYGVPLTTDAGGVRPADIKP